MKTVPEWTAIVPTLGRSPWLRECLEALRRDGGESLHLWVVDQGNTASEIAADLADRVWRLDGNIGFARANNLAIAEVKTPFVALVNDDAVIEPGWSRALLAPLAETPDLAAVQGVLWQMEQKPGEQGPRGQCQTNAGQSESTASVDMVRIDGCGLAWNRYWQAVQIGHGELWRDWQDVSGNKEWAEIFGVSATAVMWRRSALEDLQLADRVYFEPRLVSYYEDVDLACRARSVGWRAGFVPRARAFHAGSTTGRQLPMASSHLIYSNRYLVLARFLGRTFWGQLPRAILRDGFDLWHAWRRGDTTLCRAIPHAWWRAIRLGARFIHLGSPAVRDPGSLRSIDLRPR